MYHMYVETHPYFTTGVLRFSFFSDCIAQREGGEADGMWHGYGPPPPLSHPPGPPIWTSDWPGPGPVQPVSSIITGQGGSAAVSQKVKGQQVRMYMSKHKFYKALLHNISVDNVMCCKMHGDRRKEAFITSVSVDINHS